ncbi:protein aurora borealis [Bombina bombina]|uniref:protein aurora borealis n=1 Tax=Bombina bombina TaxID=8345 RepID=UPI00235A7128|nr:protein aurora borealis [Bombina bombina]XP_053563907.1 protein aurora borealis [Bombina bombina]XP_053563909.1 protein aurora borealis [Bombina bombina]
MGDVRAQLSPETPGRVTILNPFESPSDFYSLQEPFVSSPTVFKPAKSSATPIQFRWSIDQLAAINPVEIDPEDIHRQALYLSHAKIDNEIEERRQKAIEEFFTKRTIVPSPWTQNEAKQASQFHSTKCIDRIKDSPLGREQPISSGRSTVGCQTQLSLPVDFNLEQLLGEYFRGAESADQSQENLSASSLRRKLFLDGRGSLSEGSSPPSPRAGPYDPPPIGVLCSLDLSPVRCRSPMQTPSSGQFSSSPIQGGRRTCSLGSIASPTFLEKSPCRIPSPSFSPIVFNSGKTPMAEKKKLTFPSPETLSASKSMVNSCARSPYIEGCSPIKSIFEFRSRPCRGNAQYRTSLFQIPFALDHLEDDKENSPPPNVLLNEDIAVQCHSMDTCVSESHVVMETIPKGLFTADVGREQGSLQNMAGLKDNDTIEMVDPIENEDDHTWVKEVAVTDNTPMTSFMTGITFSVESSHMCMSPLAESSVIPCESSSIQVDSGYTTQTYGSSIIDGIGTENYRDGELKNSESQNKSQHFKVKCEYKVRHKESKENLASGFLH